MTQATQKYGKHTDFVGFVVTIDASFLHQDDDAEGTVRLRVLPVDDTSRGYGCDFCFGPAIYEVDAAAELGDDGHNVFYCQPCASEAANGGSADCCPCSAVPETWSR